MKYWAPFRRYDSLDWLQLLKLWNEKTIFFEYGRVLSKRRRRKGVIDKTGALSCVEWSELGVGTGWHK